MARSNAYRQFLDRYDEMQKLIKIGNILEKLPASQRDLKAEISLARSAVVLLAGHIEAYFKSLVSEILEMFPPLWDNLTPGQQKYITVTAYDEINSHLDEIYSALNGSDVSHGYFSDYKHRRKFHAKITVINGLFLDPSTIGKTRPRRIEGFYRDCAPKSIDNLLKDLRHDSTSFLKWIEEHNYDRSRIYTVLEALVNKRSDIAHGDLSSKITLEDARLYIITATVVIRLAESFMKEHYPNLGLQ